MKRISLISASLSLVLAASLLSACHKPAETSISTTTTIQTTTATAEPTTTTPVTETTPVETTASSDPSASTSSSIIATATGTYVEDRHVAKGKFNYVLKNKDWKYDGEMYYHKYKDGTVVYYDKETKYWFVMDKSGQGWYYDGDINDFVRDE